MKALILSITLTLVAFAANAQVKISGNIQDETGQPIPFATVYLDETFEGSSSDPDGNFEFAAKSKGDFTFVASAVGFETKKQNVTVAGQPIQINITLNSANQVLGPVVVTAGSFDASGKTKSTMLKPMDIVMNAGAQGDIFKAIETLPGVSQVGEETGIFVRGGDAHETKTIIDGAIVDKPFFSETPNIASRSRFDPFMFKGTTFTTGGYSAEYGRALSSVLILETQDIPEETTNSIGINMAGVNLSRQQVWNDNTALIGEVSYNNLDLLFNSVPQNIDWVKPPEGYGTNWAFRHKTKSGMIKSQMQHQSGEIGINTNNFEDPENPTLFRNENSTTYWNTNYNGMLSDKFGIYAGFALNHSTDDVFYGGQRFDEMSRMLHGKTTIYYDASGTVSMKLGVESFIEDDVIKTDYYSGKLEDQFTAVYYESDIALGNRWAFRLGGRAEYSDLLDETNVAPRTSMAYKSGKNSQVSLAYGHFYQKPENDFLHYSTELGFEKASHLIANYQWTTDEQSFRVEVYNKQYLDLVKGSEFDTDNNGEGYSRGIDVFWKDKKTIRNLDYWVSYSYIDAERNYKNYPMPATPTFVTDHTLSIVSNYSIERYGLRPGLTYTFASGRRYYNPNSEGFLSDKTKAYHNLSLNLSYVTQVFGNFAVVYGALSNPFGTEQVFGYEYSEDGTQREAVRPTTNRSFFLGLFVNF